MRNLILALVLSFASCGQVERLEALPPEQRQQVEAVTDNVEDLIAAAVDRRVGEALAAAASIPKNAPDEMPLHELAGFVAVALFVRFRDRLPTWLVGGGSAAKETRKRIAGK